MIIGQPDTLLIQPVQIRCPDYRIPVTRQVPVPLTAKLEKPFITPEHLSELSGVHDGAVDYEALQDYGVFRQAFGTEWGIGGSDLSKREDLLMKIHHAIVSVPNRGKVQDALTSLGDSPPSYQDFLSAIKSSPGSTASGPSGLTYGMMKAWPEEVSHLAYDILVKMWGAKHVPEWWKFRWLAPIPKNPLAPTVDELRPIMLLEVLRKC